MSALSVIRHDDSEPDLKAMTAPELREALDRALGFTANGLLTSARILQELESRGEDVPKIHMAIRNKLRSIAAGQMLPEVLIRFAGKPALQNRVARLPVTEQQRIIDGEPVRLMEYALSGEPTWTMQDPTTLEPEQMQQVFAADHIRSDAEQRNWLAARRAKTVAPRTPRVEDGDVSLNVDRERGGVTHRGQFIPQHLLAAALKALKK